MVAEGGERGGAQQDNIDKVEVVGLLIHYLQSRLHAFIVG
jgi:hypothetical protein